MRAKPVNLLFFAAIALAPVEQSMAHAAERGLVLLLPSELIITGGTLAVAASFLLLALAPVKRVEGVLGFSVPLFHMRSIPAVGPSLISFVLLTTLVAAGFTGAQDPLVNPLPIFIWTLWWVVFTLLQCITGNLWTHLNPWSGPHCLIKQLGGFRDPIVRLPEKIGYLPAIIQFSGFVWFELVDIAPQDPGRLAMVVTAYWLINMIAILMFGERDWFERGEPFSVFFRFIGAMAPIQKSAVAAGRSRLSLSWPGAGFQAMPTLPLSGVLFILLTLSSVSFDGLSRTFFWMGWVGVNPLEFPGRSAVMAGNVLGLIGASLFLACVFLLCVYLGCWACGRRDLFLVAAGRLVYSLIPISLVFHCAHYLTQILVNTQYAAIATNDPFARGWDLLGAKGFYVTTSFLNDIDTVTVIWGFQTAVIVIGHIIGIGVAHLTAIRLFGQAAAVAKSQIFLAALMVFYTVFGLWLVSTAAIG